MGREEGLLTEFTYMGLHSIKLITSVCLKTTNNITLRFISTPRTEVKTKTAFVALRSQEGVKDMEKAV